jgi:DNA repair protein RadD
MVGRGFRTDPTKDDCLVLDFGGNVMRHGPVDSIRIEEMNRTGGEAPAKECPECQFLIAAGYRVCPYCGYEFPPPEKSKHDAKASSAAVLSGQISVAEYQVDEVFYSVHQKRGAPDDHPRTMRVEYRSGWQQWQSEFICFEHTGWARVKAESWWKQRSSWPVPDTASEAVEIAQDGGLCETYQITVKSKAGEKYDQITGYRLGPKPAPFCDSDGYVMTDNIPF